VRRDAAWNDKIADPDGNPIWLHRRRDGTVGGCARQVGDMIAGES
jgi:hypothetical protein